MEKYNEINVVMRDYFDIAGTIINTIVCIYDLFIIKFIKIFTQKKRKISNKPKSIAIVVRYKRYK